MVFPVCNMVVARRLGLHPEEDGEEQHYEKEEDGATDSQCHNYLWAGERKRKAGQVHETRRQPWLVRWELSKY